MTEATPQVRVGDAERRVVNERLMAAVSDGVLTLGEYDERAALLWQCRTREELDLLVADLPSGAEVVRPAPAGTRPRTARTVAVMSEDRFSGAVAPGQDVQGWALMGKAVVDLRRADLPDGVHVRVRAVMGEVEVQVPPGSRVELTGMALMGDRKVRVAPGDGPVVHVDAYAVMGAVSVTVGDGSVVPASSHMLHGLSHPVVPRQTEARPVKAEGSRRVARRGPRRAMGGLKALVASAAVLGAVVLAGPDSAAVFGSNTERLGPGDSTVQVSALFGSVDVVVPDDVRVDTGGLSLFGSIDCRGAACTNDSDVVVTVRGLGAFGDVEVWTVSEWTERQRPELDEDRDEERDSD